MNKALRSLTFYVLIFLLVISITNYFAGQRQAAEEWNYSQFRRAVDAGQVRELEIVGETKVRGKAADGTDFVATIPPDDDPLRAAINEKVPTVSYREPPQPSWWSALLTTLLPILLVIGAFFFIMQQTQGGGNRVMQFGKSRARLHTDDPKKRVTFEDVAGIDEVKEELAEVVDFLKHPKRYSQLGARIPKGILLYGAPGTGKTLLARAVAGEAGVPFFSISGSDFVEMFVGVGASRVRDLFENAKKNAPCIVFIDEIDAVGRQRGAGYGGGHDEREQTLNQLLVEMDGFDANEGIIIMAATNRPDVLDPALLRPGRFDRQIVIDRPDLKGREAILKVHARTKPLEENVDLQTIARQTAGFTGADLENLLNEGALLAARRRKKALGMAEIEEAIERIATGGPEKRNRLLSPEEKRRVAYHEAGHALLGYLLEHCDPVYKISIIGRGGALGYTMQLPTEDKFLVTKGEILDRVTMALGGRAAEELIFGEVTTGAQDDLERSTKLVRRMIMEYGMSDELGPLTFGNRQDNPFLGRDIARERNYSEEVAAAIDREVANQMTSLYEHAKGLLIENRETLDELAEALLEKETLTSEEFREIVSRVKQAS